MLHTDSVCLPVPEPLALIDATLLFAVQVLVARHPELLLPPEVPVLHSPPGLRSARLLLDGIRDLHHAMEAYRALLPATPEEGRGELDDDIPF